VFLPPLPDQNQPPDRVRQALAFSPRFYEAALEPQKWPAVLEELRAIIGAGIVQLNVARMQDARVMQTFWAGGTEEQRRAFLEYSDFGNDPRTWAVRQYPYRPFHCRQVVSEADWYASDVYNSLLGRFGYDYSMVYVVPDSVGHLAAVLGMVRKHEQGAFCDDDIGHLSLYVPHLRRACEVMMAMVENVAGQNVFLRAVEEVEAAVIIVDRFGHPGHVNRAARAILDEGRHVSDAHGPLVASDGATTNRLRVDILEAGVAALEGRDFSPVKLTLPGAGGAPAVYATISALTDFGSETGGLVPDGAVVGVFITDPRRPFETDTEHLQRVLGLTATEALIVRELVATGSARKVSAKTGRGYETVRKHIKIIRDKVGAATQADLVRIVAEAS